MPEKAKPSWSSNLTSPKMNMINNAKSGTPLSKLNKPMLDAPIYKYESLKEILIRMHKELTNIIKKLNKGEGKEYRNQGEFF